MRFHPAAPPCAWPFSSHWMEQPEPARQTILQPSPDGLICLESVSLSTYLLTKFHPRRKLWSKLNQKHHSAHLTRLKFVTDSVQSAYHWTVPLGRAEKSCNWFLLYNPATYLRCIPDLHEWDILAYAQERFTSNEWLMVLSFNLTSTNLQSSMRAHRYVAARFSIPLPITSQPASPVAEERVTGDFRGTRPESLR